VAVVVHPGTSGVARVERQEIGPRLEELEDRVEPERLGTERVVDRPNQRVILGIIERESMRMREIAPGLPEDVADAEAVRLVPEEGRGVLTLERAVGREASALIEWEPDPAVARIVSGWPGRFKSDRAARLGLVPDLGFDSVVAMHIAESGAADSA